MKAQFRWSGDLRVGGVPLWVLVAFSVRGRGAGLGAELQEFFSWSLKMAMVNLQ